MKEKFYFILYCGSFVVNTYIDSVKFSVIYLKLLTFISNSIFKPPWRLNGDGVTEGA